MGQKKDIGQFFENKLNDGKKSPNKNLWEKVNASLDQEKRRRRRIFFYWASGCAILTLLGALFLFSNAKFLQPNSTIPKKNNEKIQNPVLSPENEDGEKSIKISPVDSTIPVKNDNEKLSKIPSPVADRQTAEKGKKKVLEKKPKKSKNVEETFSVSEKYYYYNSRDGKQFVSENKSEIDSLVFDAYKNIDSTTVKKKDSLKQ